MLTVGGLSYQPLGPTVTPKERKGRGEPAGFPVTAGTEAGAL